MPRVGPMEGEIDSTWAKEMLSGVIGEGEGVGQTRRGGILGTDDSIQYGNSLAPGSLPQGWGKAAGRGIGEVEN